MACNNPQEGPDYGSGAHTYRQTSLGTGECPLGYPGDRPLGFYAAAAAFLGVTPRRATIWHFGIGPTRGMTITQLHTEGVSCE